jgi:phospholipid/cholesterol/gamma-HCH transport system ATP-binding protein
MGLTSVFVSHELKQTLDIADHVIVLANGKVAIEGTPDDVRTSTDPMVYQYVNAKPDGPVHFHFPGLAVEEDFALAATQNPRTGISAPR